MNWLAFITNIVNRVPFERFLFPPPDHTKAAENLVKSLPQTEGQIKPPSGQKTTIITPAPQKVTGSTATTLLERPGVSTEETIAYHNREIGKQLLAMESHYAQRMRIAGKPCDCGATKHLLYLEQLCQETIPMVDNPSPYQEILQWLREVEPKSSESAAQSGKYDEEYPRFSGQARDFRKKLVGTLSPSALVEPKAQITLEEAKNLAAEEAAREVEKRWQSREKKPAT